MKYLLLVLASLIVFSNCHRTTDLSQLERVAYGESYGECAGYCDNSILLDANSCTSTHLYFNYEPDYIGHDTICMEDYKGWASLIKKIDFYSFKRLPDRIGCPDCADGGAEWIQITYDGEVYRVVFEAGDEPPTTSDYIELLRAQLTLMQGICL